MPVDEYGQLIYFLAISIVTATVARIGLGQTVTVQIAKGNNKFTSQAVALNFILSGILSIFLFFINPYLSILTLGTSFFLMEPNILQGKLEYKKYFRTLFLNRVFQIACAIPLYYLMGINGILLAVGLISFASGPNFVKSLRHWNLKFDQIKVRKGIILQNFGVESAQSLPTWVDKLVLIPLLGFTVGGMYQFSYQILLGLGIVPMILYNYLLPEESSGSSTRSVIKLGIVVSILLAVIAFFLSPILIPHLFPKYTDSITSIQIMSFGALPLAIISIIQAKLQSQDSKLVGTGSIIRIASHLTLIPLLWNILKIEGLAIAVIISILLHMVYLLIVYYHQKRKIESE